MTREQDFGPDPMPVETPFGTVGVKAVGGNQVRIEISAMEPIAIRGVQIYGSVFMTRNEDGSMDDQYESIDRVDRREVSHPLKVTMREVFREAAVRFCDEHPDLLRLGALMEVNNDLYRKEKAAQEMRNSLRSIEEEIADLTRIEDELLANAPGTGPRP